MALANSRLPKFVLGRHQRRGRRACAPAAAELVRLVRALRARDVLERGRAHVRPRRGGRPQLPREAPRRPLRRARARWTTTGSPTDPIPFEVVLEIDGSTARLDFSRAPVARRGPVNCPIASTVSAARVVMTMLAGGGEAPNEGHFRPIEVVDDARARCSTALSPSPCFLYGWPAMQATEAVLQRGRRGDAGGGLRLLAAATSAPRSGTASARRPASSGATARRTRSARARRVHGDGQSARLHHIEAATRFAPLEVWEAKNPWIME